jgi:hypothetical protein
MQTEIVIRGYPSRKRFAEWQKANMLPDGELPQLTVEEKRRASLLRVPEKAYAIALKAGELARDRAFEGLERVANAIAISVKKQDPNVELKAVTWDFFTGQFEFVTQHKSGSQFRECAHGMAPELIDELVLGRPGADQKLIEAAQRELTLLVA